MASYRGHLMLSVPLGAAYAGLGIWHGIDPLTAGIAGLLGAAGGLLPDLDSDSGMPVRILFTLFAVMVPGTLLVRLLRTGMPDFDHLLMLAAIAGFIRYVLAALFKHLTVHRGMFHSIPAVFISGLVVFLLYRAPQPSLRVFVAGAVMAGFLSHLVLDQFCNVDFSGGRLRLKQHAGPVLKLASSSRLATATAYALLLVLGWLALGDLHRSQRRLGDRSTQLLAVPGFRR